MHFIGRYSYALRRIANYRLMGNMKNTELLKINQRLKNNHDDALNVFILITAQVVKALDSSESGWERAIHGARRLES
jgi:DNA-binding transcriptional regulator YbjK